jgi:hypothetical protein
VFVVVILIFSIADNFIGQYIYTQSIAMSPLGKDIDFNGDGEISFLEALDGSELKSSVKNVSGKNAQRI